MPPHGGKGENSKHWIGVQLTDVYLVDVHWSLEISEDVIKCQPIPYVLVYNAILKSLEAGVAQA